MKVAVKFPELGLEAIGLFLPLFHLLALIRDAVFESLHFASALVTSGFPLLLRLCQALFCLQQAGLALVQGSCQFLKFIVPLA